MEELKQLNTLRYKRSFFSVRENFLNGDVIIDADFNYFIQFPININNQLNEFHTILIDLTVSESKIWNNIYERTQTEITSYLNNQQFEYHMLDQITRAECLSFVALYKEFATKHSIHMPETFRILAYLENGLFRISYIKQRGIILTVNFYRVTKNRATNIYTFNVIDWRKDTLFSKSHQGRAHRALHWLDILEFKKIGVQYYDFCGWYNGNTDRKLLQINKFKESFSKQIIKEYSGVIYQSKLLRLIKKLK